MLLPLTLNSLEAEGLSQESDDEPAESSEHDKSENGSQVRDQEAANIPKRKLRNVEQKHEHSLRKLETKRTRRISKLDRRKEQHRAERRRLRKKIKTLWSTIATWDRLRDSQRKNYCERLLKLLLKKRKRENKESILKEENAHLKEQLAELSSSCCRQ